MKTNTVQEAIQALKEGNIIVVSDDETRENEGDLIAAASLATPKTINFMATHAKGLICTPMSKEIADRLGIKPMVCENNDSHGTPFGISIDHNETSTGISAYDRALTANKCADKNSKPSDFKRPGHMFPLIAKKNGVLERNGHTEATVDLMRLAGLEECGLCVEIMNDDGTMCKVSQLSEFAKKHKLVFITIKQIQEYRKQYDNLLEISSKIKLPTEYGIFDLYCFVDKITNEHHLAFVKGDVANKENVISRIHSECLTGDVFGSLKCDCGKQLANALKKIQEADVGILFYLRQEGRNIGLVNKLRAYKLQEDGLDTVDANLALGFEADQRDYYVASQMVKALNIKSLVLLTNNPDKIEKLKLYGTNVTSREALKIDPNPYDENYLYVKQEKLGHLLNIKKGPKK